MLGFSVFFCACGDDEDDKQSTSTETKDKGNGEENKEGSNYVSDISGIYEGTNYSSFAYGKDTSYGKVELQDVDGLLKVNFNHSTWGEYVLEGIEVIKDGENYKFSGADSVSMGHAGAVKKYDFSLQGKVNADKELSMTISIPKVMQGVTLTFKQSYTDLLVKTYDGTLYISTPYFKDTVDNQKLTLSNEDEKLVLSYDNETWGTYTTEGMSVEKNTEGYGFSGKGTAKVSKPGSTEAKNYDASVSGIKTEDGALSITINVPSMMNASILFTTVK